MEVLWCCLWGRGPRWNNGACSALCQLSVTPPTTTSKLGPSGADSCVGGFVYVLGPCGFLQQTLLWDWEFLPLLQPPQTQNFTARGFEALFSWCWNPRLHGLFWSPVVPPGLSACECGTAWSATCCLTHPVYCLAACPLHPGCPSLSFLPVWMNVSSLTPWLPDFHTAQFSGSSGCFLFLNLSFRLYEEAKCIYLCLHLGQKSGVFILKQTGIDLIYTVEWHDIYHVTWYVIYIIVRSLAVCGNWTEQG